MAITTNETWELLVDIQVEVFTMKMTVVVAEHIVRSFPNDIPQDIGCALANVRKALDEAERLISEQTSKKAHTHSVNK